jgi:phosphohistidine phosphatase
MAIQKYLYLLRHGEAEPGIGRSGDLRRSLTVSGKKRIKDLSLELKRRNVKFDLILKSPSLRTSQTAKIISDEIPSNEIIVEEEIYEAELHHLLKILNKIKDNSEVVLLVGHNPSLSTLVSYLTGNNNTNMSPGMLAIIEIEGNDWTDLKTRH